MALFLILNFVISVLSTPVMATTPSTNYQDDIDQAYRKILSVPLGRTICRHILGADPAALEVHLGVSKDASEKIAKNCGGADKSKMIFPTDPKDIQKLTLRGYHTQRTYKFLQSDRSFPIESWTEPFTNTTYIVAEHPLPQEKLVQILAHEMAVYFDSKANPAHPDAVKIPSLRSLTENLRYTGSMDPLIAVSDPLIAHTLTYVRALQIEMDIITSLLGTKQIKVPDDYNDRYLTYIKSRKCTKTCLQSLVLRMRGTFSAISLPLIAFAPHFRSTMLSELQRIQPSWTYNEWQEAEKVLNQMPVDFLKTQFSGAPLSDIKRVFSDTEVDLDGEATAVKRDDFAQSEKFLNQVLWPLELEAISSAYFGKTDVSLLEYLKSPLLSGYNISLSSGPRVRIRTGGME